MVYGTYDYSYWGESKPTNITGGPHMVKMIGKPMPREITWRLMPQFQAIWVAPKAWYLKIGDDGLGLVFGVWLSTYQHACLPSCRQGSKRQFYSHN